jgi:type IV pilus assembly protein PilP
MLNKSGNCILWIVLAVMLVLSGCSGRKHMRDLQQYVAQLKQTSQSPQKTSLLKNLVPPTPVTYTATHARSPFISNNDSSASHMTSAHPLQNYQVEQLSFKGTVTQGDNTWAFILAPDNKLYQVKLGDMIGNHYGKIINISSTTLVIREPVDALTPGTANTKLVTLQLKGPS